MATTRPDRAAQARWTGACLLASLATPALAALTHIQPTLNTDLVLTSNGNLAVSGPAQSDVVMAVTPGLTFFSKGASSEFSGQWQFTAIHSMQGLQQDRVVPKGEIKLHTDVLNKGIGLDASLASSQVQSSINNGASDTPSTTGRYTNTVYRLSPFFQKDLDDNTAVNLRLNRALQQTSQLDTNLLPRPDARLSDDTISLVRKPTPLGYSLTRNWQDTRASGLSESVLRRDTTRGTVRYALTHELEVGLIAGYEHTRSDPTTYRDHLRGWLLNWRPTDRTTLQTSVEKRFFGQGWRLDLRHRTPWFAMGLNAERTPGTTLFSLGGVGANGATRDLFDAMLLTRIPDAQEREQAVTSLLNSRNIPSQLGSARDFYNLTAQLRQAVSGRIAFMGRRDTLLLQSGYIKTVPLDQYNVASALTLLGNSQTRQYYAESQLTHQLTPQSSLTGGLRWSRASERAIGAGTILSRDFSWRLALNTSLTRDATATLGLRRVLRHAPSTSSAEETALFLGLGYRF